MIVGVLECRRVMWNVEFCRKVKCSSESYEEMRKSFCECLSSMGV